MRAEQHNNEGGNVHAWSEWWSQWPTRMGNHHHHCCTYSTYGFLSPFQCCWTSSALRSQPLWTTWSSKTNSTGECFQAILHHGLFSKSTCSTSQRNDRQWINSIRARMSLGCCNSVALTVTIYGYLGFQQHLSICVSLQVLVVFQIVLESTEFPRNAGCTFSKVGPWLLQCGSAATAWWCWWCRCHGAGKSQRLCFGDNVVLWWTQRSATHEVTHVRMSIT